MTEVRKQEAIWDIGIVADDLTGASDTAVHFARQGWDSLLLLDEFAAPAEPHHEGPGTLVLTTDARALANDDARIATELAVNRLMRSNVQRLYIKIDSTMRGSVTAQVNGALRAWRQRHGEAFAVVCPAYPALGRTVEASRVRVHGTPLEESPSGRDPVTPVATSSLASLLPGSSHLRSPDIADSDARASALARALGSRADELFSEETPVVLTVDAVTTNDLDTIAEAVVTLNGRAVPSGSAGLAQAMARAWSKPLPTNNRVGPVLHVRRILMLVTSLHQVAREQEEHFAGSLDSHDLLVLRPALQDVRDKDALWLWYSKHVPRGVELPDIVALTAPSERLNELHDRTGIAANVANNLAELTVRLQAEGEFEALLVVGGDGARAVLHQLAATGVQIMDEIAEGIPFGYVVGGSAPGLPIITKAGGFGSTSTLTDVVRFIRSEESCSL